MRVIELSIGLTVLVDCVVWTIVGVGTGYATHRLPVRRFDADGWITRLRPFEVDGRWYERHLRIKRWKRHLPEAGSLFAGGFSKRALQGRNAGHLDRFIAETRRAEITHWAVMACGPLFVLWNPWGLTMVMLVYAFVANGPCLVVQRYNRARLLRVTRRQRGRLTVSGP